MKWRQRGCKSVLYMRHPAWQDMERGKRVCRALVNPKE
jgi:hypothetical protein